MELYLLYIHGLLVTGCNFPVAKPTGTVLVTEGAWRSINI